MLKGIHPSLGVQLLETLAAMGHGDVLAVVDRNYPAMSTSQRVIEMPNTRCDEALEAILTLFPVDDFESPAAWRMGAVGDEETVQPVHAAVQEVLNAAEGRDVELAPVERFDFYSRVKNAFAVVHTTDDRPYGCFLITKGVV